MKDKTFFRSLKAVLLLMAVIATSCIPMNMSLDNAVIAEAATKIKLNKTKGGLYVSGQPGRPKSFLLAYLCYHSYSHSE